MQALKAVQQNYTPTNEILGLLEDFRRMVNDCLRIGLAENVTSMKALSLRAYRQLSGYDSLSYYKLCAISAAAGILRNHRKARHKGLSPKRPYARRLRLTTCYGFKIKDRTLLPLRTGRKITVPLNRHTRHVLSEFQVRSVTLTPEKLSLAYAKDISPLEAKGWIAIDLISAMSPSRRPMVEFSKSTSLGPTR